MDKVSAIWLRPPIIDRWWLGVAAFLPGRGLRLNGYPRVPQGSEATLGPKAPHLSFVGEALPTGGLPPAQHHPNVSPSRQYLPPGPVRTFPPRTGMGLLHWRLVRGAVGRENEAPLPSILRTEPASSPAG